MRFDKLAQSFREPIVPARFSHENQPPVAIDHPQTGLVVERIADLHVGVPGDAPDHEALFAVSVSAAGGFSSVTDMAAPHLAFLVWSPTAGRSAWTSGPK